MASDGEKIDKKFDEEATEHVTEKVEVNPTQYEYLDHTADVQFHSWGSTLGEAIEQQLIAMYGYMALDINYVEPVYSMDYEESGSDMKSLLYNLMDRTLYDFNAEPYFIGRCAKVLSLDEKNFKITARVWGESFDLKKHQAGTEIKAITYSNMQINEQPDGKRFDIYVVVDI